MNKDRVDTGCINPRGPKDDRTPIDELRLKEYMQNTFLHTTLSAALMAGIFVLFGAALFQSDVSPDPTVAVPTRLRNWLRRADMLFKPAAFIMAWLAVWECAYDLGHARVDPGDLHVAEAIAAVLALALLVRAVARPVLESLWRPASEPHLAPILRDDDTEWLWVVAAVWLTAIQFLPIAVGSKFDVGIPVTVAACLIIALIVRWRLRRSRQRSNRARIKRERRLLDAGWQAKQVGILVGKYEVPIEFLEHKPSKALALTDEQFTRLRANLRSTILYAEADGLSLTSPPAVRRKFRILGGLGQELCASVPVPGIDEPLEFSVRMTRQTDIQASRLSAMLFLVGTGETGSTGPSLIHAFIDHSLLYPSTDTQPRDIAETSLVPTRGVAASAEKVRYAAHASHGLTFSFKPGPIEYRHSQTGASAGKPDLRI